MVKIMINNINPNLPFTYKTGQKVVYKTTITGGDTAYRKGKIDKLLHNPYYQLESNEMIHQSQVITVL